MEEQHAGREHEKVRMQDWHLGKEKGKRGGLTAEMLVGSPGPSFTGSRELQLT